MPRCGLSQERSSDQNPSIVLTWTSKSIAIVVSRILAPTMANSFMPVSPVRKARIDIVLVRIDQRPCSNRGLDERLNRFCLTFSSMRMLPPRSIMPNTGGFSFSSVPRPRAPLNRLRRPVRFFF
jgi:hypothetical protein